MFNQENYLNLLCSIAPKKIESEEQYEKYLPIVESFLFATTRTEEQEMVGHILALLVEEYEEKHYPIPELTPLEFLKGTMENLELKQKDLVGILGSKGVVSEVLNGKREISKAQAKALGEYFKVSYKNFL
jgi:HTH-type transcriptional regulator / antitoxin HigA